MSNLKKEIETLKLEVEIKSKAFSLTVIQNIKLKKEKNELIEFIKYSIGSSILDFKKAHDLLSKLENNK